MLGNNQMQLTVWVIIFALLLSACASQPVELTKTDIPEQDVWHSIGKHNQTKGPLSHNWWDSFGDPELSRLVKRALAHNPDITLLKQRVELARAGLDIEKRRDWPTFNNEFSTNVQKTEGLPSVVQYSQQFNLAWEVDIWGRNKYREKAEYASYQATQAGAAATLLSVASDVVNRYIDYRFLIKKIKQQELALQSSKRVLENYTAQYEENIISASSLLSQQAEIERIKADKIDLLRQKQLVLHSLSILLGDTIPNLSINTHREKILLSPPEVPIGIPGSLLSRRPDLVSAKYRVEEAAGNFKHTKNERFPSIQLSGQAGSGSLVFSEILKSWTFGLAPTISIPLLDPSLKPRIKQNEINLRIAQTQYKNAILQAYKEVEDALTNLSIHKEKVQIYRTQREKLRIVSEHMKHRLREGLVSQLEVFEIERTLLAAEQALLNSRALVLKDTVILIKSLGGGWQHSSHNNDA